MRVALVSLNWVEYLVELGNALQARGHQVDIVMKRARVRETVGDALPELVAPGVRYHLVDDRPSGLRDPRQLWTIARLAVLLRRIGADVVNLHEATNSYLPLCFALAGRRPLVLTVHDVHTHVGVDSREPARWARVREHFRRRADAVIVHGETLRRDYLAERGAGGATVHAIPHGCYTVIRHWAQPAVAEIPRSALFFGRIHEYKGLAYLLRARDLVRRQLPDFRIIVAGTGADLAPHRATLLEDPLCTLDEGYLSNARVAEVFQQAAVVVLPYVEGSQSGVVRIAYTFGKPVVVTDVGSVSESVNPGRSGLVVPPRDERALADALVAVLGDEGRRVAMGREAARMAAEDLSWARVARETEGVYREVAGRG